MSLITINATFDRVVVALERIAEVLEYACPRPLPAEAPIKKSTVDAVSTLDDEEIWLREQVEDELLRTGAPEEAIPGMAERIINHLKNFPSNPSS